MKSQKYYIKVSEEGELRQVERAATEMVAHDLDISFGAAKLIQASIYELLKSNPRTGT